MNQLPEPNRPVELVGLSVTLDKLEYHPELPAEIERPYPLVYFLTIHNNSAHTITFQARKWIVTDRSGHKQIVEGKGIVGQQPTLAPGERFSYNSYHIIGTDGAAEGSFHGVDEHGGRVFVRIPRFELKVPAAR